MDIGAFRGKPVVTSKKQWLCVEGGAHPDLDAECRKAFMILFEKAGIADRPKVRVCHGRSKAFKTFCNLLDEGDCDVWLLVDSEDPIAAGHQIALGREGDPWAHVGAREGDRWLRPSGATDEQLQFMTVSMETWLISDRDALKKVFTKGFQEDKLPSEGPTLETQTKKHIQEAMAAAVRGTPAERYDKGAHSFKILAHVSPDKLRRLPWAARFLAEMGAAPDGVSRPE